MAKADDPKGAKLVDTEPVSLRALGHDEKWLQKYLAERPDQIGRVLGAELEFVGKEIYEPRGGRLDLLFQDSANETRYCVELMLGDLDESHFVRLIEYWDEERTKYTKFDHVAVLVAEEVAGRFSNLFALISKTIPIVACKVVALKVGDGISIQIVKVLDFTEQRDRVVESESGLYSAPKSEEEWMRDTNRDSFKAVQSFNEFLRGHVTDLQITYNRGHIALGTPQQNFGWQHPRKKEPYSFFEVMVGRENIDEIKRDLGRLEKTYSTNRSETKIRFQLFAGDIEKHRSLMEKLVNCALRTIGYLPNKAA